MAEALYGSCYMELALQSQSQLTLLQLRATDATDFLFHEDKEIFPLTHINVVTHVVH